MRNITDNSDITTIQDSNLIKDLNRLVINVIEDAIDFNEQWIVESNWAVVPVESASHFTADDIERLLFSIKNVGINECYAIPTEKLLHIYYYKISITLNGLTAFNRECGGFNYILIPNDAGFAILCTAEDYFLVGGKKDFVQKAIGGDIEITKKSFYEYASNSDWYPRLAKTSEFLISVCEKYKKYNG